VFDLRFRGVIDQREYIRQSPAIENPVSCIPNVFHLPFLLSRNPNFLNLRRINSRKLSGIFSLSAGFEIKKDSDHGFL